MSPRPWHPGATSLLWAHEIRRENIHLTDELDSTKTSLASVIATTSTLKESITELQEIVQELRKEGREQSDRLRGSKDQASKIESLILQAGELREVNTILKGRIDKIETELASRRRIKEEILDEMRATLKTELEHLKNTVRSTNIKESSFDLIPDSMPVDGVEMASPRCRHPQRGSSEITAADSDRFSHHGSPAMAQGKKTLAEYLAFAEDIRSRLPPRKREGLIVEEFLDGLDDPAVRAMLGTQLDNAEWVWGVMSKSLLSFIGHRETLQSEFGARAPTNGGASRKRKRPPIPVVPVDDEDILY